MSASDLHHVLHRTATKKINGIIRAERCRVATSADEEDDEVMVTLIHSKRPDIRHPVHWRVQVGLDGADLVPRFPQRGDEGVVIHLDTGELWLLF